MDHHFSGNIIVWSLGDLLSHPHVAMLLCGSSMSGKEVNEHK